MIPGPDQIIACPNCKEHEKYRTLISGNTFGAKVWTDGKQIAPMLPRPPAVVKCHYCGECYWLADAKKIKEVHRGIVPTGQEDDHDSCVREIKFDN
jgi:hypothetical protein